LPVQAKLKLLIPNSVSKASIQQTFAFSLLQTENYLSLKTANPIQGSFQLTSANGKIIKSGAWKSDQAKQLDISIQSLPKGIYFVHVFSEHTGEKQFRRFIR
jgi:hypothetical protein